MTHPRCIAHELAIALLAGPPESALERGSRLLGRRPRWLAPMIRRMAKTLTPDWNPRCQPVMAQAIQDDPAFRQASRAYPGLRLIRPDLTPLQLAPALFPLARPNLPTPADIARWLDMSLEQLAWFAGLPGAERGPADPALDHYHLAWREKRSGGYRLLEQPRPRLKAIQRRLLHELLEFVPPHEAATGFQPGHSCLEHARRHTGRAVVIRLDLRDFFLHVGGGRVWGLFRVLGYPDATARMLTGLCVHRLSPRRLNTLAPTSDQDFSTLPRLDGPTRARYLAPHLPQGAPTSPTLANLCAFRLDLRLQGLADSLEAEYSRYADDLTFSGGRVLARAAGSLIPRIGAIALEEGFALNHHKTRIMHASQRQTVTGIVVNAHPNLARDDYDALKALLFNCVRHGPASQNREGHPDFRAHLLGRVSHAAHLNPTRGNRLLALFQRIVWP